MGYSTNFTGAIHIDPPLPWALINGSGFTESDDADLKFWIIEDQATGVAKGDHADAIVPAYDEPCKGYNIVETLQAIVDQFGAGRTFTGYIRAEGEDTCDLWRLEVQDGRAIRVDARWSWPDEDPVLLLIHSQLTEEHARGASPDGLVQLLNSWFTTQGLTPIGA